MYRRKYRKKKLMIPIYVGYDTREAIAYHTCANSIIRQSSEPVSLNPLALSLLKGYDEKHVDGSNHFIYSRFLVPYLQNYKGWALFLDGDMILRDDIAKLWAMRDNSKAVMVVKHDYKTRMTEKYLGAKNENYPRKNWSSVILWNCGHELNQQITPEFIQSATGAQLHRFTWIPDDSVGELPVEWNWLPDEFGANDDAKLLHYTLGTPCFHDFATTPMADEWHRERIYTEYCQQHGL
jgi:lipopolysaccharide biosynthesis glycosyltransferase